VIGRSDEGGLRGVGVLVKERLDERGEGSCLIYLVRGRSIYSGAVGVTSLPHCSALCLSLFRQEQNMLRRRESSSSTCSHVTGREERGCRAPSTGRTFVSYLLGQDINIDRTPHAYNTSMTNKANYNPQYEGHNQLLPSRGHVEMGSARGVGRHVRYLPGQLRRHL